MNFSNSIEFFEIVYLKIRKKMKLINFTICIIMMSVSSAQYIWVLNNGDPDFQNPPFNDSLKVFNADGTMQMSSGGFNICQQIGGTRWMAISPDGNSAWVNDYVNNLLVKIDLEGNILYESSVSITGIDLTPNGYVYALTSSGTIYGDDIIVLDDQGSEIMNAGYGGIDIAVDDENNSVWIAGADLKKMTLNLEHQFTIDYFDWTAISIDYANDGTAWVGEGGLTTGQNRLLHIDENGDILQSHPLTYRPNCVRVDRIDNTVWIASDNLYRVQEGQTQLEIIDNSGGFTLTIDQFNNLIWVASYSNVRSFTKEGDLQTVITNFDGNDQKYVAAPKSNYEFGDVNHDLGVNILDIVLIVNMILGIIEEQPIADLNQDESINVLDIMMIVNIILES